MSPVTAKRSLSWQRKLVGSDTSETFLSIGSGHFGLVCYNGNLTHRQLDTCKMCVEITVMICLYCIFVYCVYCALQTLIELIK